MRALLLAIALVPALALGQAQVPAPRLLPYQGRLLRADGSPETGAPRLTFRVYDAATGGTALWSEPHTVPLTNGYYAVFLGSVASFPSALFDGHDRWVSISVDDGPELTPRQQIGSVAYAISATNALVAADATHARSADRATTAASADHATTADRATTAQSATEAQTAARTRLADRATLADEAALARSVNGPVTATTLSANSVTAGTVIATSEVTAPSLHVTGAATFDGGISGAGSFRMSGLVNADGTVRNHVGDPFVVTRPGGTGRYRVTAERLTANAVVLVTVGDALERWGFACVSRHDGFFDVQLRAGTNSDGYLVEDPWTFVVLAY